MLNSGLNTVRIEHERVKIQFAHRPSTLGCFGDAIFIVHHHDVCGVLGEYFARCWFGWFYLAVMAECLASFMDCGISCVAVGFASGQTFNGQVGEAEIAPLKQASGL